MDPSGSFYCTGYCVCGGGGRPAGDVCVCLSPSAFTLMDAVMPEQWPLGMPVCQDVFFAGCFVCQYVLLKLGLKASRQQCPAEALFQPRTNENVLKSLLCVPPFI